MYRHRRHRPLRTDRCHPEIKDAANASSEGNAKAPAKPATKAPAANNNRSSERGKMTGGIRMSRHFHLYAPRFRSSKSYAGHEILRLGFFS
jgi:hypothetical protein